MTADPADLGVIDSSGLLHSGELSAIELLAACQRRIAARNGGQPSFDGTPEAINAWVRLYPELAEQLARRADERLAREGAEAPPLCGIPLALKDLFAVEGLPLTASSRVLEGNVADSDSAAWARLRDQGMVLVGHTHTHEFAAGGTTDQVGNPWRLDRSPGGSSGGSGAALAAGMVPAALGTDTAGSVRIPAALCGISSIKPTRGRVSAEGVIPLAPTLDHVGPMARSIADCRAILDALCQSPGAAPAQPSQYTSRPLADLVIAVTDRPAAFDLDPDVADGLDAARRACERLGARLVELPAAADVTAEDAIAILFHEAWLYHRDLAESASGYRPSVANFAEVARRSYDATAYALAQERRAGVTEAWRVWFAEHGVDLLLEPTVKMTAPLRGHGYDGDQPAGEGDPLIVLTSIWNFTGFPVAALPAGVGTRSGLPVGVSLIALPNREEQLLSVAIEVQERELPPPLLRAGDRVRFGPA